LPYDPLDPDGKLLFTLNLQKVPVDLTDDLPEWLQTQWDVKLIVNKEKRRKMELFQGEWKGGTVYYIFDPVCLLCPLLSPAFYSTGEEIDWKAKEKGDDIVRDFCYTSKEWKKIREYDPAADGS
jgi:hypothetical protein